MKTKYSTLWTSALLALLQPVPAFAVQAPQQLWDWPGYWHVWSVSPALWWTCTIVFTFIGGVLLVMFGQRSSNSASMRPRSSRQMARSGR